MLCYCLCFLVFIYSYTSAQVCNTDSWGDLNGGPNYAAVSTYKSFLVVDEFTDCAGKIVGWRFPFDATNSPPQQCHQVVLQVYRPQSGGYILVGENTYIPECPITFMGPEIYLVHEAFQIPVQQGDLIGWTDITSNNSRMFEYTEGLPGSNLLNTIRVLDNSCREAHSVCDWDQYVAEEGRKYALRADLERGDNPFIDNLDATTQVAEHQSGGIEIYRVIGSNDRNYNDIVHANFTYNLTGGNTANFQIDPVTGVIITIGELNHEVSPVLSLSVTVAQGPYASQSTLRVSVIDINEPHTLNPLSDVRLDAVTTRVGTIVYDPITVTETDTPPIAQPPFTGIQYLLVNHEPAADIFRIDHTSTATARLECTEDLSEWQGPETIDLYISATDGFYTSGPEKMTVTIYNIWQPPTIDNLPNTVTKPETAPFGTIYTVTASKDVSRGIALQYSIVGVYPAQSSPPQRNPFSINSTTGVVSYIGSPTFDYMTVKRYEVEVQVNDGTFDSVPENLTVEITWDNEPPIFDTTAYTSSVPELSPMGTLLPGVLLNASDRDILYGDWLDYTISGIGSHLFHASNITNTVFVKGELLCDPGQATKVYDLKIAVTDSFGESDNRGTLTVNVTDVNNHVPVFRDNYYEGTVSEIALGATSVLEISASDDDAGENADMSFVVLEEDARIYFEVIPYCTSSPCDRQLQMKQPISYVDYPNITFTLVVFDHGIPSLNSTSVVYVEVLDENNHPPEFVQEYYNLETRTDLEDRSEVARVEVYDPDTDINSNVSFVFLIPTEGFMIEKTTGIIRNKDSMQAYKTHICYVYARDWGSPEFYSDPSIVRLDTYTPQHHLVDIHMEIPLTEFIEVKEEFLIKLNEHIAPWYAKEEEQLLDPYQSILTIYALEEKPPESLDKLDHTKTFVHRNPLLGKLRVNIPGKPQDWLRDEDFAEYQVFKVLPTYPIWFIDTIPGIVTLTLLCLLFLLLWVAICYGIFRGCKKKTKVAPMRYPPVEEYALKYGDYAHVHYTEDPKTGTKKGVLSTPLVPLTTSKKSKNKTQVIPEEKETPIKEVTSSQEESVSELPPVESTTGISAFRNKPLPPSGQNRIL